MIACSHPGRTGDLLNCLPAIKALCLKHGCKSDVFTSTWCAPMEPLFRYQHYINDFIVPKNYVIECHSIGIQPAIMPIPKNGYESVYQMGFTTYPEKNIPDHISASQGFDPLPLELEYPLERKVEGDYLVACTKSMNECSHHFPESPHFFEEMGERMPLVIVGMQPLLPHIKGTHTMANTAEMASLIHFSRGVVCAPSLPCAIAHFVPDVKIVTLKGAWLDGRQLWRHPKQLVFEPPKADVNAACEFLGI